MASRSTVKQWFKTGLKPTQQQFFTLFESIFFKGEDQIDQSNVAGLAGSLALKADRTEVTEALAGKQNTLTAGENITITDAGVISATGGGGSSVTVEQTTGQSTTSVMSQKAVTDELAGKASSTHTHQQSDITGLTTALSGLESSIAGKQDPVTVGTGLTKVDNLISLNAWRGTQTQWDALSDTDKATYYIALIIE